MKKTDFSLKNRNKETRLTFNTEKKQKKKNDSTLKNKNKNK